MSNVFETGKGKGAGDERELPHQRMEDDDPDKIMSLGMDEMPHNGTEPVYRTCSVNSAILNKPLQEMNSNVSERDPKKKTSKNVLGTTSSFSISKFLTQVPSRICSFKCCKKVKDDDGDSGIELSNLCVLERKESDNVTVDDLDGTPNGEVPISNANGNTIQETRMTCLMGPVMTLDCSNTSVDAVIQRMNTSIGDAIRKLIVRNSPIQPALRILREPVLYENISSLQIENCDLSVRDLWLMLENLKVLEQLYIEVKTAKEDAPLLLKQDFDNFKSTLEYFKNLPVEGRPQKLRVLTLCLPLIWQCSLICQTIETFLVNSQLEEITIKSSLKQMITHLVFTNGVDVEDETTWQDLLTLQIRDLIQKNSSSLKFLSISCADTFPLEYLKLSKTLEIPVNEIYRWSFLCTCGVLNAITSFDGETDVNKNAVVLPELKNLSLNLPLVPIPMAREDDFRKPLNAIAEFLARNNCIHVVSLHGLRPVKGMENWMRNSLVTIPKYRMSIGCTYTSTTLASNLPTYDDELGSLGLEIVPDETRQRVTDIIDPNGLEVIPHTWRYSGLQCFHLVNQLPTLISYDLNRIASKFSKLTKLVIEDYALIYRASSYGGDENIARSLTDIDMQTIFQKLVCLEYLHLDCNMKHMTDRGITGMTDSLWSRLTQRDKMYSFWYLYNLKYVFLRGFGDQVTDKSAVYAFSEEYSMKQLKELHVFAPGFTNFGREKIRRAYEDRNGFVLEF